MRRFLECEAVKEELAAAKEKPNTQFFLPAI